jgi:hypothetical protein
MSRAGINYFGHGLMYVVFIWSHILRNVQFMEISGDKNKIEKIL